MQRRDRERGIEERVEVVRRRFEQWRRSPDRGRRIPDELWQAAADLAERQGVHRTGLALGLNAQALRERVAAAGSRAAFGSPGAVKFVEVAATEAPRDFGAEWILELEDGRGAKLRVRAGAWAAPDLAALTRAFLRDER